MQDKISFTSASRGLWIRFITKSIGTWALSWFVAIFIGLFASAIISAEYLFFAVILLAPLGAIYLIYKDFPYKWNNIVTLDFDNNVLHLSSTNSKADHINILDFDGMRINFSDIEHYHVQNYESLLFSSYFLVSIYIGKQKINLASFKDAVEYSEFVSLLENRAGLKTV